MPANLRLQFASTCSPHLASPYLASPGPSLRTLATRDTAATTASACMHVRGADPGCSAHLCNWCVSGARPVCDAGRPRQCSNVGCAYWSSRLHTAVMRMPHCVQCGRNMLALVRDADAARSCHRGAHPHHGANRACRTRRLPLYVHPCPCFTHPIRFHPISAVRFKACAMRQA